MPESAVPAPSYLTEEQKKAFDKNTLVHGNPVYIRPFWFWPTSFSNSNVRTVCRPFVYGLTPVDIHACAVWNEKPVEDVWFETAPVYLEDMQGPDIIDLDDYEVRDPNPAQQSDPTEQFKKLRDSAHRKSGPGKYTLLLFGVVAITATGVYLRKREKG